MRVHGSLFLALRETPLSPPIVELRVDAPSFWDLDTVTVIGTPDGKLVGASFANVVEALGQLKHYLHTRQPVSVDLMEAYVVCSDRLDEALLGSATIRFKAKMLAHRTHPGLPLLECAVLEASRPVVGVAGWPCA